ncbi:MAG: tetratricopeptide repeat protein, partial [Nitrospinota bacterium]|nr:tetratricopeptide repeat protein [Nitrospinota bacterium]
HAATKIQGLILLAVEQAIAKANPSDTGAEEKDDRTGGPLGWALDFLDDIAIWIYWLISVALNLVINAFDSAKREVYWKVIEGDRLEGLGKDGPAMEQFAMALKLSPGCVEALESMVKYSMAQGKYDAAHGYLDRLLDILGEAGAEDPSLLKMRADLAFFQRQFAAALPKYESLQPQFPLSYIIPYRIGLCLLAGGDDRRALEFFEQALSQVNPGLLKERVAL